MTKIEVKTEVKIEDKTYHRRFHATNSRLKGTSSSQNAQDAAKIDFTPGFPNYTPDFSLVASDNGQPNGWRHLLGFGEVKAVRSEIPMPRPMETIPTISSLKRLITPVFIFILSIPIALCGRSHLRFGLSRVLLRPRRNCSFQDIQHVG